MAPAKSSPTTIAVFGASGFVGRAVVTALERRGAVVVPLTAPRAPDLEAGAVAEWVRNAHEVTDALAERLSPVRAVVNAAGMATAGSAREPELNAANAATAALIAVAARRAGVERLVHISSAAVQGSLPLDETRRQAPFSPYSRSKALGERLVSRFGPSGTVIYRPPGVHAPERQVTRAVARLAASRFSSVAAPGDGRAPHALLQNVADAVAFLALSQSAVPRIVMHPWEGMSTGGLLTSLGGHDPVHVPPAIAKAGLTTARALRFAHPRLDAIRRRIEVLWFGQPQGSSWLEGAGWAPPLQADAWDALGARLRQATRAAPYRERECHSPLKVLMVTDHFQPDLSSTGRLWTDLAVELVAGGLEVSVVTAHSSYNTNVVAPRRETHKGVQIRRLKSTQFDRTKLPGRLVNEVSFSMASFVVSLRLPRPDVILSLSSPPFLPPFMALAGRVRRVPFVYVNYDIFPDIAVAIGLLSSSHPATWAFERALRFALRRATRVVVIGRCMESIVRSKLAGRPVPIDVIHNWSDGTQFFPIPRPANRFLKAHPEISGTFVVQYSGNMGRFQDFESILAAAARLHDDPAISFVIIGDGFRRQWVIDQVLERQLSNVTVLPFQPQEVLNESLNAADVSLVTLERGAEGLGVPSKFYPVLATGTPVLAVMHPEAEVARVVREHRLGHVVEQGDVDGLCAAIVGLKAEPTTAREMGERARAVFLEQFDRPVAMSRYLHTLEEAVGAK